jgi:predicted phage tail protein
MQIPGFRQKMNDGWYQIRIAGLDVDETSLSARLHEPLRTGPLFILSRVWQGQNRWSVPGWCWVLWQSAHPLRRGSLALWGSALSAGAISVSSVLFSMGAAMMLGGVAQMLTPQAKIPVQADR